MTYKLISLWTINFQKPCSLYNLYCILQGTMHHFEHKWKGIFIEAWKKWKIDTRASILLLRILSSKTMAEAAELNSPEKLVSILSAYRQLSILCCRPNSLFFLIKYHVVVYYNLQKSFLRSLYDVFWTCFFFQGVGVGVPK